MKSKSSISHINFTNSSIYSEADQAGMDAVDALSVRPMVVTERSNSLDDASAIKRSYYVEDGVCGFAWVQIKPANSSFAKYMQERKLAKKSFSDSGVCYWIYDYNQSMQKKEAYACAFAKVLNKHGINAYSRSRMD